jgi:hypothetical protein
MVTLCRLVVPLEEAPNIGGTTIASATRTIQSAMAIPRAGSPHVAMSNKRRNNPLARLATGARQGLKAKLYLSLASRILPRLILGRRSMKVVVHDTSSRQGEGTIPTDTTTTTIMTASPPSPPTSPRNPTPRISNQLASPSMMASKTRAVDLLLLHRHRGLRGIQLHQGTLFPVALESVPLTWLESLKPNSTDSWEDLKRAFIDNFQGFMNRAGTHHDLS